MQYKLLFKLKFFKVSVIVVPMSKSLWTVIEASICCANSFAMYNPNPEPPVLVFRESSTLNVLFKDTIEVLNDTYALIFY